MPILNTLPHTKLLNKSKSADEQQQKNSLLKLINEMGIISNDTYVYGLKL